MQHSKRARAAASSFRGLRQARRRPPEASLYEASAFTASFHAAIVKFTSSAVWASEMY
jgi:hypothetical protein